jgi:hypothetical protein
VKREALASELDEISGSRSEAKADFTAKTMNPSTLLKRQIPEEIAQLKNV